MYWLWILSLKQCPLRNPEDQFAQESAGAHFQDVLTTLLNQDAIEAKTLDDEL